MTIPVTACYLRRVLTMLSLAMLMIAGGGTVYGSQDGADYLGDYWPENIDGTDCLPQYHRLMVDLEKARVVDVMIPAATAEIPHTHKIDSFMLVDRPTPVTVRNVDQLGNEKIVHQTTGDLQEQGHPPIWQYMEPEPYHYVENRDPRNHYRAIRIEIRDLKESELKDSAPLTDVRVKELFRKGEATLYKVQLSEEPLEIQGNGQTFFLIGSVNSKTSVLDLASGDTLPSLAKPAGETADRPAVWVFNEYGHYLLASQSGDESAYLLEISK